ncbi:LytR/AlgR family response regulator transcription factor [Aquibacillus salsiterrae]|uniref:LytTR family DNA-binding domain-containing protein n=1 Tax=Aquibacillus salsiterrae TaxID=2950439 RepID=A0A9X3WD09_9BACI|nr:LytTR family DNA-binding domain-containing protein [Aquibacillus salsiterrae]MDC3417590.1 LytTR family DNA-binding domain-containing protein [Aquibacillus salsiterrae]
MTNINVIIAEDNPDAQEIISSFLKPLDDFTVTGIVDNGESLIDTVANKSETQLIIVDIDMPKIDGITAVESCLKINPHLKVIFTTAYDQFAVKAFDLNALDYVLKPIKKDRLYIALQRVKSSIPNQEDHLKQNLLTIKMDRISYFIPLYKIIFIEKDSRKTIIHTKEQHYETNEPLDSIFRKLDNHFFRTHRSFIINTTYLSHITFEGETYFAHFRNYPNYAHVSKLRINELYNKLTYPN